MNRCKLLAAALLACLPLVANAGKWYVGLDAGKSMADARVQEHLFDDDVTAEDSGSSIGIHLHGGYQFGRFFAMEVSYADFGEFKYSFDPDDCPNGNPGPCPFSVSTTFRGFAASVVGIVPVGERWSFHGRMGLFDMQAESRQLNGGNIRDSNHEDGFQWALGAGLKLDEHWQLAFDYASFEQLDFGFGFNVIGDFGTYDLGDTKMLSVGITYRW